MNTKQMQDLHERVLEVGEAIEARNGKEYLQIVEILIGMHFAEKFNMRDKELGYRVMRIEVIKVIAAYASLPELKNGTGLELAVEAFDLIDTLGGDLGYTLLRNLGCMVTAMYLSRINDRQESKNRWTTDDVTRDANMILQQIPFGRGQ